MYSTPPLLHFLQIQAFYTPFAKKGRKEGRERGRGKKGRELMFCITTITTLRYFCCGIGLFSVKGVNLIKEKRTIQAKIQFMGDFQCPGRDTDWAH